MNEYFVTPPFKRCLVEVYDKYPRDDTAVLLNSGYIDNNTADGNTLQQMEKLLPLEQWDEVLSCSPKQFWSCTAIVLRYDIQNDPETGAHSYDNPRTRVQSRLDRFEDYIFPKDPNTPRQLVIVQQNKVCC